MRRLQNYTPENFAKSSSTGLKRKRVREHFSCETCRSRKVACDRQQPCENCIKLKCPDECRYDSKIEHKHSEDSPSTKSTTASHAELSITNSRVSRLESLIERLAEKFGVDVEELSDDSPYPATEVSNKSRAPAEHTPFTNATLEFTKFVDSPFYIGLHHWGKPCGLELKYFWLNSMQEFSQQITGFTNIANQFNHVRRRTMWDMAVFHDHTAAPQTDLLNLLPDRDTCDAMVSRFLLSLNLIFPIVDPRMLQSNVDKFWEQKRSDNPCWLPLYLALIALGYQLPVTPPINKTSDRDGRRAGKTMMESVIPHAMRLAQLSRRPSLPTFQTLLLFILHERLAQDWVDGNDLTNGYLGLLARMAATMGLHRDPKNFPAADDDDVEMRRQIFWTYTLVELEHVLQSGMPCQYRNDGHDVEAPRRVMGGWPPYMQYIVGCIPTCEKVLRFSDCRHVEASSRVMSSLADNLRNLASLGTHNVHSDGHVPDHSPIVSIQQAIYLCLNQRVQLLVQWPLLESNEQTVKLATEGRILESCEHMLQSVEPVITQIASTPEDTREAWAHLAIALLRCPLLYAISLVLSLCRRCARDRPSEKLDRLKKLAYEALQFLDSGAALSFDAAKAQVLHWTQYYTIVERVRAQETEDLCTRCINIKDGPGRELVTATKNVMNVQIDSVLAAIERTRKTANNPPPNLLETPRVLHKAEDTTATDNGDSNDRIALQDEAEMLDWLFTFEDWTTGPDAFSDTTAIWS